MKANVHPLHLPQLSKYDINQQSFVLGVTACFWIVKEDIQKYINLFVT